MSDNAPTLPGMPEPYGLSRLVADGETIIFRGPYVVGRYEDDDLALRNLVIVSLRDAGHCGAEVAACFGFSEEYVSRLHARARREGSSGLVRSLGRPRKLSKARAHEARTWSAEGLSNAEIARRLRVHPGTIGRLLGTRTNGGAAPARLELDEAQRLAGTDRVENEDGGDDHRDTGGHRVEDDEASEGDDSKDATGECLAEPEQTSAGLAVGEGGPSLALLGRIGEGGIQSRYAGAMLLHPFLSRLGVHNVLASLPREAARRYDAPLLVLASTFGFALGISSLEGSKHLLACDAGALVGLERFPHLRTLRPALKSLAKACDPLGVQRAFSTAMLSSDESQPELFYVDDHFVTYWGQRPVAKGYNIRRHLAEPGRDDTFVVDDRWRAICFSSGEPRGLSVSMANVIGQLGQITATAAVMVGFDRGGSYPKVFSALTAAGMDWVTWRRAPLVTPNAEARRAWVVRDGKRRYLQIADEQINLEGYEAGPVRQLSSFEHGRLAFQILTSNTTVRPGPVVAKLRGRWCIENFNKYVEDHHGAHWLCSYEMDIEPDTTPVTNPARKAGSATKASAKQAVAEAERALGAQMGTSHPSVADHVTKINAARDEVVIAKDALADAKAALKGIPAKLAANELDPNAKRARPHLAARALQMVCRLLAYNAELDLARRFNNYLDDPDEYRAITRNLLHLGGMITYEHRGIVVSLDRPDSPRIARALTELVAELNAGPVVHLAGDQRPLTYQIRTR